MDSEDTKGAPTLAKLFLVAAGLEQYTDEEQGWMKIRPGVQRLQESIARSIDKFRVKELFEKNDLYEMAHTKAWEPWQNRLEDIVKECDRNPFYSPFESQVSEGIRQLAQSVRRNDISRN